MRVRMPSVITSMRVLAAHASFETGAKSDALAHRLPEKGRHAVCHGASGNAARLEHQDLLLAEPGAIQQKERRDGALAGAWRRFQQYLAAPGQRCAKRRKGRTDGEFR